MDSQDQNIDGSSIENSSVQQNQAGRDAISLQNSHNNKVIINNIFLRLFGKSEPPQVDWDWGIDLLKRKQLPEIRKRLTDTLGSDRTLMDVSIEEQPNWVNRPLLQADRNLLVDGRDCGILDAHEILIETFGRDDIGGKLLILGAPGAGKTTVLLSLAEQLVKGAISNPKTVIPVIFELSTWRDDSQSIESWLIDQLYELHGGNRKFRIYEQWLERQVLLPLLDGLDELGLERQRKCTKKLNEFTTNYPQLVVCCRIKEFETADIKLQNLRGAVCLQSLSDEQIQHYFNGLNRPELWSEIQANLPLQALLEKTLEGDPGLLRVPLFTKLMAEVYDSQKPISGKTDLLDKYVDRQLSFDKREFDRRKEKEKSKWAYKTEKLEPDCKETSGHLRWLAKNLQADHKIEFLIEHMQPSWLNSDKDRYWYRFIFGFTLTFFVSVFCYLLLLTLKSLTAPWLFLLILPLTNSFVLGLFFGFAGRLNKIEPVESFEWLTPKKKWKELKNSIIFALVIGFFSWSGYSIIYGIWPGLSFRLILEGFLCSLASVIFILIIGSIATQKQVLKRNMRPNQGIWTSFQNHLLSTIFFAVPVLIILMLFPGNMNRFFALLVTLQCGFQVGGGMAWLQHFFLRIVLRYKGLPWDLANFLKYCEERKLIQSVGGRYRFIHRELLDYFAPPNQSN